MCVDLKNRLVSQIKFNPDKTGMFSLSSKSSPNDCFRGGIYRMNSRCV